MGRSLPSDEVADGPRLEDEPRLEVPLLWSWLKDLVV